MNLSVRPSVCTANAGRPALRYNTSPFPITRLLQPSEICEVIQKHTKDLISKSAKQGGKNEEPCSVHASPSCNVTTALGSFSRDCTELGARDSVPARGIMLSAGTSRVQFPIKSLEFSIRPILLWEPGESSRYSDWLRAGC
jgi:hypothetical protein